MDALIDSSNFYNLVKKARNGCRQSIDDITGQVAKPVAAYIYRLTLDPDLTDDLLQETMIAMVCSISRLRDPERFWVWLYRIALSKVQHHYRGRQNERLMMPDRHNEYLAENMSGNYGSGLDILIQKELAAAIVEAVSGMKLKHRNVLMLRCYQQMSYDQIADIMDCNKLAAQLLFFRAKNILKRKLSVDGFAKSMLLAGLGLFGNMTTPKGAVPVTVKAAAIKTGTVASIIGIAGTKLGLSIAAMITAAAVTVGSVAALNNTDNKFPASGIPARADIQSFHFVKQSQADTTTLNPNLSMGHSLSRGAYEQWYFFPKGVDGPMFMMMQRWDPRQSSRLCGWLQNGNGNFYFHSGKQTLYLYNYHLPLSSLKTRRLISDTPEFTAFLDHVEGTEDVGVDYVRDPNTGLLIGMLDKRFYNPVNFKSSVSYNSFIEKDFDTFRYPWPKDAPVIDERDEMHKRGWTYFTVTGLIHGEEVDGKGRIPFIYNALNENPPFLTLNIGRSLILADDCSIASVAVSNGALIASYPAGTFFEGLPKPWMGMNTIDIIRRDAVEKKIKFSIKNYGMDDDHYGKAKITLFPQKNGKQFQILCLVDIDRDILEEIDVLPADGVENSSHDFLKFTYLQDITQMPEDFNRRPELKAFGKTKVPAENIGLLWLVELAQGTLGK